MVDRSPQHRHYLRRRHDLLLQHTVCHAAVYWSKSTSAGASWSTPQLAFPAFDASSRTAIGYPQAQPSGGTLNAPAGQRVDSFFPAVAAAPNGNVYVYSYAADVV